MRPVYLLTLRQLSGRWRLVIMTVLATLPVGLALLAVVFDNQAPPVEEFEMLAFSGMLVGIIMPLIVLAIAASAFANELDDRTIANLTLAPIPRWQIVVPKLLAAVTLAAPFIAASAFATAYIGFLGDWRTAIAVTVSALAGVALYGAAFLWLGLMSTQAIGIGLLYIVIWEGFFAGFVEGVRLLSLRYYALGIMHALDERRFSSISLLSPAAAIAVSVVVFTVFVLLAIRRLRRMDIP